MHHLPPSSPEMHSKETKIAWFAVSTSIRSDYLKKIMFEDVYYQENNFGLGVSQQTLKIHNSEEKLPRILPYKRPF